MTYNSKPVKCCTQLANDASVLQLVLHFGYTVLVHNVHLLCKTNYWTVKMVNEIFCFALGFIVKWWSVIWKPLAMRDQRPPSPLSDTATVKVSNTILVTHQHSMKKLIFCWSLHNNSRNPFLFYELAVYQCFPKCLEVLKQNRHCVLTKVHGQTDSRDTAEGL